MSELAQLSNRSRYAEGHLEQAVEATLRRAAELRAPLTFVGVYPLPDQVLRFRGRDRDWILAPFHLDPMLMSRGDFPVPSEELRVIDSLLADGFNPLAFIGHDVPPSQAMREPVVQVDQASRYSQAIMPMRGGRVVAPDEAQRLVSPVVAPRRTRDLSDRLGRASEVMIKSLAVTATIAFAASVAAVGVALAPLFVGAATGTDFVDPIIFGAVPLTEGAEPGSPAAWFVISAWSYE